MIKSAKIDNTGIYRYRLRREWSDGPTVAFIMLNPSTADADIDDPTIRRCIGFAKAWGYGSLEVVNLFALRATDPKELYKAEDPVGPSNDLEILDCCQNVDLMVAAWGTHGAFQDRGELVAAMLPNLMCLGITKSGHPRHPLYLRTDSELIPYKG